MDTHTGAPARFVSLGCAKNLVEIVLGVSDCPWRNGLDPGVLNAEYEGRAEAAGFLAVA